MRKRALIIFVRKPEKGKVKTRLAATIGEEAALLVYQKLLHHTAIVAQRAAVDTFVFFDGGIVTNDEWTWERVIKRKQGGGDLGKRMQAAFTEVFHEGYSEVVIIGSDCPELTTEHLRSAFTALQNYDVVIGPASDGGYYLLGMRENYPHLFQNIYWSTAAVYQQTCAAMQRNNLSFFALPVLTDVDEEKDLPKNLREEISQHRRSG
jgi:hypothetical protein